MKQKRVLDTSQIADIEYILDEEIDVYEFQNSLDEDTVKELRFITLSFSKYYKKEVAKDTSDIEILLGFEDVVQSMKDGVFGTSFNTLAPALYRDLPTIKKMYSVKTKELYYGDDEKAADKKVKKLEAMVNKLTKELTVAKRDLIEAENKVDYYKRKCSSSSSYSSYGSCGGGSSYGRC